MTEQGNNRKPKNTSEKNQNMDARKSRMDSTKKFTTLLEYLRGLSEEKFTGYIKINFTQGSIAKVEKFEEVLKH